MTYEEWNLMYVHRQDVWREAQYRFWLHVAIIALCQQLMRYAGNDPYTLSADKLTEETYPWSC